MHTAEGGIILNTSVFYLTGGGQPGDSGELRWSGGIVPIASTIKNEGEDIIMVPVCRRNCPLLARKSCRFWTGNVATGCR